jgi:hypothetical protein
VSLVAAGLVFVPVMALLPRVAEAPELEPARVWSARAVGEAKSAWQAARSRAHQLWMKEPGASSPSGEP